MSILANTAIVQQVEETEKQIIASARAAIAKESDCKWEVGRLACVWTRRHAKDRTDNDFAELVGLSRRAVQYRRQVYEAYCDVWNSSSKLTWTHYRATLDWDDAAEWLAEADERGWSVATMKMKHEDAKRDDSLDHAKSVHGPDLLEKDQPAAAEPLATKPTTSPKRDSDSSSQSKTAPQDEVPKPEELVDRADSVARNTIPGIQEAAKLLNDYLLARDRSGVDTDRVLTLSTELTEIFFAAKREVSRCK